MMLMVRGFSPIEGTADWGLVFAVSRLAVRSGVEPGAGSGERRSIVAAARTIPVSRADVWEIGGMVSEPGGCEVWFWSRVPVGGVSSLGLRAASEISDPEGSDDAGVEVSISGELVPVRGSSVDRAVEDVAIMEPGRAPDPVAVPPGRAPAGARDTDRPVPQPRLDCHWPGGG